MTVISTSRIGSAVQVASDTSNTDYTIASNAIIFADNSQLSTAAIKLTASQHDLVVHGAVSGYWGVWLGDDAALDFSNRLLVSDTGSITGSYVGTLAFGGTRVENDGAIRGGSYGIYHLVAGSSPSTILNTGLIAGGFIGVNLDGLSGTATRLTNTGTLSGGSGAYRGASSDDVVVNRGLIVGRVELFDGNDVFDNRGGTVIGGDVFGGAGNDTFLPGASVEILNGDTDIDTLDFRTSRAGVRLALEDADGSANTGRAKNDRYTGIERVVGSNTGDDTLAGDTHANTLVGGGGADILRGRNGADRLDGAAGGDRLTGGLGDDTFVFRRPAQGGDVIGDFHQGSGDNDRLAIDTSGFGGGLVAGLALTGAQFDAQTSRTAQAGAVRFIWETDDTRLWFDRNGNAPGGLTLIADLQDGAVMTRANLWLV